MLHDIAGFEAILLRDVLLDLLAQIADDEDVFFDFDAFEFCPECGPASVCPPR